MTPPRLYKYLDVNGAFLTLRNQTFKHAKPSDFNDIEDMTIQSVFPEPPNDAYKIMYENFTDTILKNIDHSPTCANLEQRVKVDLLQQAFRNNPKAADLVKAAKANDVISDIFDLEHLQETTDAFIKDINEFL